MSLNNASKLNKRVIEKQNPNAWADEVGTETDLDLLIDKIRGLSQNKNY